MEMIGGGEGFPQAFGGFHHLPLQDEELFQMHYIRPTDGFFDYLFIGFGVGETIGLDDGLEDRENVFLQGEIRLRLVCVLIGTGKHADILSHLFKFGDGSADRCAQSVTLHI